MRRAHAGTGKEGKHTMDEKKTAQALKQIFDQCGTGIIKERNRFEAYLEDLLPGSNYVSERRLLRHALDSDALTFLLRQPAFTETTAMQAVGMLQRDIYVGEEAARFVVRCVIIAQGGVPRLADKAVASPPEPAPLNPAPAPQKPHPTPPPQPPASAPTVQAVPCELLIMSPKAKYNEIRMAYKGQQQGGLQMLPDKLVFTPTTARERTEISYCDITKINMISKSQAFASGLKIFGVFILVLFIAMPTIFIPMMGEEGVLFTLAMAGMTAVVVLIEFILWNYFGSAQIHVEVGKLHYNFIRIKDQTQCMHMYTALRRRIHQNP